MRPAFGRPADRYTEVFEQMCLIPEVGQAYVSGIVTEADPAIMPDAIFTAVDDEPVQVLGFQHRLEMLGVDPLGILDDRFRVG